eukprot:PhM_4_TR17954/c0_g2_i1/m.48814
MSTSAAPTVAPLQFPERTRLSHVAAGYVEDVDVDGYADGHGQANAEHGGVTGGTVGRENLFNREPADQEFVRNYYLLPRLLFIWAMLASLLLVAISLPALVVRSLREAYNQWVQFMLLGLLAVPLLAMLVLLCLKQRRVITNAWKRL